MEVASESGITEPNQSGLNNEEDNNPGMVQQRIMKDLQNWALYMVGVKTREPSSQLLIENKMM